MNARLTYSQPEDPLARQLFIQSVEYLSGRGDLENRYNKVLSHNPNPDNIWKLMVENLDLDLVFDHSLLKKIPVTGPLVFIANHPFGVVDGIVLGYLVSRLRTDFKFLVNAALCRDEILNQFFLPIDFALSREAQQTNIQTRKIALECIQRGEPVVIFPSGGVATAPKFWQKAEDLEWKQFVVKLVHKSKATVIPIYFYGQNSRLFQVASQLSQDLRLSLLLNEVRNKIGKKVHFEIGDPLPFALLEPYYKSKSLLQFLNNRVHSLAYS